MSYYLSKTIDAQFDDAVDRVREVLGKQGFGILTDIDVQETLKKKLDMDFRRYRILGACHPQYAHRALELEDKIGVMLPCSVIVQEIGDGRIEVAAMDPVGAMSAVGNPALANLARDVRERLSAALESLAS